MGSANASEPEESGRSSPPTQQPSQDALHPHIPSGHPHEPPQQSSFGTSTRPQADRASSCRPPPLDPPSRSTENKPAGRTDMFVGSIPAERFLGGWGKVAARLRKASNTPPKGSCCELCPGSGRAIPPKRSMQWGQLSEQGLRLEPSSGVVEEGGTRCSMQSGQAHSKPQQHPVPANSATDFIEGIGVGVVKRGPSLGERIMCSGSKSKGGSSGPLIGPSCSLLLITRGGFLGAQQLLRTGGGAGGPGRASSCGDVGETGSELMDAAAWRRVSRFPWSEEEN